MVSVLRPGQRIINIPAIGVSTSRRAVGGGNGLLNNLVAYWPLNEAGGANNALDLHTNGLTLTQVSSPGADTGKVYATARTFDGANDYFTQTSSALLQIGGQDFSFAAWCYSPIITKTEYILGKAQAFGNVEYELVITYPARTLAWMYYRSGYRSVITTAAAPINTWYLVIFQFQFSTKTLFISINNSAEDSYVATDTPESLTGNFDIGARAGENHARKFTGRIGPVTFWKSAAGLGGVLTAAQRTALYNAGAGLPYASFTV